MIQLQSLSPIQLEILIWLYLKDAKGKRKTWNEISPYFQILYPKQDFVNEIIFLEQIAFIRSLNKEDYIISDIGMVRVRSSLHLSIDKLGEELRTGDIGLAIKMVSACLKGITGKDYDKLMQIIKDTISKNKPGYGHTKRNSEKFNDNLQASLSKGE